MTRNRKYAGIVLLSGILLLAGWASFQVAAQPADRGSLASLMPQGALVFLEAKDFSALLKDWSASPEKQAWLKSDNYEVFSRSRLFQRLQQVQKEFATAAGVPPDMAFLGDVAGQQTALGWYDIGKLELLYITRLPSSRVVSSALWQKRSQFEPRMIAGKQFFVRTDPESGRVVAFALDGDYFVVGTREDLVAGALSLLANQHVAALDGETWFTNVVKAAKGPGDVRMVIHLAEASRTPYFSSYWIQRNVTAMRQYESSLSDLFRSASEYREERVLLPSNVTEVSGTAHDDEQSVASLLRFVPAESGFYRATASPSVDDVVAMVEQKILMPQLGPAPAAKAAPAVNLGEGTVGSDSNLETRIDVPPTAKTVEGNADEMLRQVVTRANVRALLVVHGSDAASDGVFVRLHSAVVLNGSNDWDEPAARAAIQRIVAPALTTSQLGAGWKEATQGYWQLDGLAPSVVAVRGKFLVIGNDAAIVAGVLARFNDPISAEPASYAAGFKHDRERQNFYRLAALVDRPSRTNAENYNREPQFFSQNIAGLSQVLAGVKSESVIVRRNGGLETQTVRYEWAH